MTTLLANMGHYPASYRRMVATVLSLLCVNSKQAHSQGEWIMTKLIGLLHTLSNYHPLPLPISFFLRDGYCWQC